ncbi:calcium/sodium antiporter [Massilia sp. PAMC28688]|uniref:calcium/sodium antiporter n=1 Tax=Massilia sp. PAMC28688 TaxID=2861283 RepID=UPI001C62DC11|nr:calcium/sodium antiporter [Massilia sp. PAMC28688]QYF91902.1 calcium/sodium antiporter [Massilia sp. PAMC28688]
MLVDITLVVVGLVVLVIGAEALVRGAASLAARLNIPPLVIGLTVVSFGTSAPELTVNLIAAFNGSPDLAVGNVVGSNIGNILLILGVCAMIVPLEVKSSTVWKEIPFALLAVVLVLIMGNDAFFDGFGYNALTRTDGIALLSLMGIFMYYVYGLAMSERGTAQEISDVGEEIKTFSVPVSAGLTLAGLGGLVLGGHLLVTGAVNIAKAAGLSEALIGLTIVAIGTSLPELATSVVAALKKQADIAIGNIVGSNIFNVFFVLGATSTITALPINATLTIDILVSVGATALLLLFMFTGGRHRLVRWEGALFLALYAGYLGYLINRG